MADVNDAAYAVIGRAIIQWGLLEQHVVRQIQRAKDPLRSSPFPPDLDERVFTTKWDRWLSLHRDRAADQEEFERLALDGREASKIRNDLCHQVFEVVSGFNEFSVGVHRRELRWRKSFAKWAAKWAKADARARPPPPQDEVVRYSRRDLDRLMTLIASIRSRMDGYAAPPPTRDD